MRRLIRNIEEVTVLTTEIAGKGLILTEKAFYKEITEESIVRFINKLNEENK